MSLKKLFIGFMALLFLLGINLTTEYSLLFRYFKNKAEHHKTQIETEMPRFLEKAKKISSNNDFHNFRVEYESFLKKNLKVSPVRGR